MARTDVVGHDQFPQDICGRFVAAGENVGVAYGATRNAIDAIQRMMLAEPWSRGCAGNHHCTEDNPAFKSVGIGLARAGHFVFLSEDFKG
jgi:hypothetical protein